MITQILSSKLIPRFLISVQPVSRGYASNFALKWNQTTEQSLALLNQCKRFHNHFSQGLKTRNDLKNSKISLTLRGKGHKFSKKYNSNKFAILSTGGVLSLKIISNLKTQSVYCENVSVKHPMQKDQVKKKFILFRLISKVISVIRLLFRAFRLLVTFTPILVLYPFTLPSKRLKKLWWILMLWAFEFSGPAFVKLGQWASTRRDLFSKEFCDRFRKLHHDVSAHPWKDTCKSLKKAYGRKWKEILLFGKNAQPIGSGCVAQVYKAYVREERLSDVELDIIHEEIHEEELAYEALMEQKTFAEGVTIEGMALYKGARKPSKTEDDPEEDLHLVTEPWREVTDFDKDNLIPIALKVLHPGVRETFARDLTLLYATAKFVQFVIPSLRWISLTECVAEFAHSMKRQMNMKHEAKCLDKLRHNFSNYENVKIPVPLWPLITRDVLVETFEDGEPISNFLTEDDDESSLKKKLAELGVEALLQMVFVHNFVHGDLHPGNILVQHVADFKEETSEDELVMVNVGDTVITGVKKAVCPVKLVFLDCGITATLKESDRQKFREVFTAVVKGEGEAVADLFLTKTAHVECTDHEAFRRDMSAVVMKARRETLSLSKIHVAELMSEVFQVLRTHRVKLESNFATVILAIAVLEGLGRSLDPDLDILEKARPILINETLFS